LLSELAIAKRECEARIIHRK